MTRGKQRRRWVAKAWRKAHPLHPQLTGYTDSSGRPFRTGGLGFYIAGVSAESSITIGQGPADPNYGRPPSREITPAEALSAYVEAEKKANDADTPRFVAYSDKFADAWGLPRTGGAVVEVPRKP